MALNQVTLIGNLTRDPELKYTPKGTAFTNFGLAMSRVWFNDEREKFEETTFVDITIWGNGAEWAAKYIKKGVEVGVIGRLKLDQWDDKQTGQARQKLTVVAESLFPTFGTWKDKSHGQSEEGQRPTQTPASSYQRAQGAATSRPAAPPTTTRRPEPRLDPDLDQPEDDIPF